MKKNTMKPGTMLYPLPVVLISCGTMEKPNVMTAAWTGIINSSPPMTYVSVRPERLSHSIIKENMEFVINLTTKDLAAAADYCGCVSGRKEDKFEKMGFIKLPGDKVKAPLIEQCPVNVECKVFEVKELGSHHMFMAEIVAVHGNEDLFNGEGRMRLEKADLLAYIHGKYMTVSRKILGDFGFSVMKPKTKKKKAAKSRAKSYISGRGKLVSRK